MFNEPPKGAKNVAGRGALREGIPELGSPRLSSYQLSSAIVGAPRENPLHPILKALQKYVPPGIDTSLTSVLLGSDPMHPHQQVPKRKFLRLAGMSTVTTSIVLAVVKPGKVGIN